MIFAGVDPGKHGALVTIDSSGVHLFPFPDNETQLWLLFAGIGRQGRCVLEEVHSLPHDGHVGAFKFGRSYGFLRACLVASGIPFVAVTPQQWQSDFGMSKFPGEKSPSYKARLKIKAQLLYPDVGVTKDTADALLLAHYCKRHAALLFPPSGDSFSHRCSPECE